MKEIPLSKGRFTALVDDQDFDHLSQFKWFVGTRGYAFRHAIRPDGAQYQNKSVFMHREIMNPGEGFVVDHLDGNQLNNQKTNLRICTQSQNITRRKLALGGARIRGKRFQAFVRGEYLGTYETLEIAKTVCAEKRAAYYKECPLQQNPKYGRRISKSEAQHESKLKNPYGRIMKKSFLRKLKGGFRSYFSVYLCNTYIGQYKTENEAKELVENIRLATLSVC